MDAREGQVAVEVACGCDQATLVVQHMVADWSCGKCRHKGQSTGRQVTLGPYGALPVDWRDQPIEVAA